MPDRIASGLNLNGPGDPFNLERTQLETPVVPRGFKASRCGLLDMLRGNVSLSIPDDEAEEWRPIIKPILDARVPGRVPRLEYPASPDRPTARLTTPPSAHGGEKKG
jgi:glucose-6-phosphate 1-dehydrogenase